MSLPLSEELYYRTSLNDLGTDPFRYCDIFTSTSNQTVFNLTGSPSVAFVYIDNILQYSGYTISTNVLTLSSPLSVGRSVRVVYNT